MRQAHTLKLQAAEQAAAAAHYCHLSAIEAARGKRDMAFFCLEMAALHRRVYVAKRAALARAQVGV
jgi:hypothetical protein